MARVLTGENLKLAEDRHGAALRRACISLLTVAALLGALVTIAGAIGGINVPPAQAQTPTGNCKEEQLLDTQLYTPLSDARNDEDLKQVAVPDKSNAKMFRINIKSGTRGEDLPLTRVEISATRSLNGDLGGFFVTKKETSNGVEYNSSTTPPPGGGRVGTNGKAVQTTGITVQGRNSGGKVNSVSFDLKGTGTGFNTWPGNTLRVLTNAPTTNGNDYSVKVYGIVSVPCKCEEATTRKPPRELTQDELKKGTAVYVSATPNGGQAGNTSTQLNLQIEGSSTFTPIGKPSNWVYNALSYNTKDNWIYAISQRNHNSSLQECYPAGHLLQINPATGVVHDLGLVKNAQGATLFQKATSGNPNDLDQINTGTFDLRGSNEVMWVGNTSTSGSRQLYKIPLPAVGAKDPRGEIARDRYNVPFQAGAEDHVVLPSVPQYLWGLVSPARMQQDGANPRTAVMFERINMDTGERKTWTIPADQLKDPSGNTAIADKVWGKAWLYGNGNLGFGTGGHTADQVGMQIRVFDPSGESPHFQLVSRLSNLPASYNTDATSNPGVQIPSDLKARKTTLEPGDPRLERVYAAGLPRDKKYWALEVENIGKGASSGFTLYDILPATYEDLVEYNQVVYEGYDGGNVHTQPATTNPETGEMTKTYFFGPMPAGGKATVIIGATLKSGAECRPNTASVINHDKDEDPTNDTAYDSCPGALSKTAIDTNGDGKVGFDDIASDTDGQGNVTYTAAYDVTVKSFDDLNEYVYPVPTDTPKLPKGAKLTDAEVYFTDEYTSKDNQPGSTPSCVVKPDVLQTGSFRLGNCDRIDTGDSPEMWEKRTIDPVGRQDTKNGDGTHRYRVKLKFTLDKAEYDKARTESAGGGEGGVTPGDGDDAPECSAERGGFANSVKMGDLEDEGCYPGPDKTRFYLWKVDSDSAGNITTIPARDGDKYGAQFAIYDQDPTGPAANKIADLKVTEDGKYLLTELDYGTYYLLETKSPDGYQLLPTPVKISIKRDANGKTIVESDQQNALFAASKPSDLPQDYPDGAWLQVANVHQGVMPKTGGDGVMLPILAGLLIAATGAMGIRRRLN